MLKFFCLAAVLISINQYVFSQYSDSITINHDYRSKEFRYKGENINMSQTLEVMESNPIAYQEMTNAVLHKNLSFSCLLSGVVLTAIPIINETKGRNANWTLAGIGIPMIFFSFPLSNSYTRHYRNAVRIYNSGLNKKLSKNIQSVRLGLTNNGFGVSMNF